MDRCLLQTARMPSASTNPPHPRPQLQRPGSHSLAGPWEFAVDQAGTIRDPGDVGWTATITVPVSPETPASGIGDTGLFRACWYRRRIQLPPAAALHSRLLLHFGAVDHRATVWANGS